MANWVYACIKNKTCYVMELACCHFCQFYDTCTYQDKCTECDKETVIAEDRRKYLFDGFAR